MRTGGFLLPEWLVFDTATRTFSGTPQATDVGTLEIVITTDDGRGGSAAAVLRIGVNPTIPTMPEDFTVTTGATRATLAWMAPMSDGGSPDHPLRVPLSSFQ